MEMTEIKRIYAYYSRVYDFIFKRWFFPRQQHAIESLILTQASMFSMWE